MTPVPPKILCLGEISWDSAWVLDKLPTTESDYYVLDESAGPGGCALNSAFALAATHTPVVLAGNSLGQDEAGKNIFAAVVQKNLEHRLVLQEGVQTPQCQTLVEQATGKRSFLLRHADVQKYALEVVDELANRTQAGEFPYVFVQLYVSALSTAFLTKLTLDNSVYLMTQDLGPESEWVPRLNAIQISLPDELGFSRQDVWTLAEPYLRGRCQQVFMTAGKRGVACCTKAGETILQEGLNVNKVVDTTGCGDAFRAGLLKGLFEGRPLAEAMRLGQEIAALKSQQKGSTL